MKAFFRKKRITAVLFILMVYGYSAANLAVGINNGEIKEAVEESVLGKYHFIEGFGALNHLLDKKEENNFEVVKDAEGVLYNTYFSNTINGELEDVVSSIDNIRNVSKESGAEFMVISPPDKFLDGVSAFDKAYPYNYENETIAAYEEKLASRKIDLISLTEPLRNTGWKLSELFYKTDHHWTTLAGFVAFQQIVSSMETLYNVKLDPEGFYTNKENYNYIWYNQSYLGSQGRKTGVTFSGLDDFCLIYPKFYSNLTFEIKKYSIENKGRIEDALIDTSVLNSDLSVYDKDYYGMYLHGVMYPFGKVVNRENMDGPKVLVIRDSYSCVPMTFFSSLVSEMDLVYPLLYEENLGNLIRKGDYDYVMVLAYPSNYTREFFDMEL